MDAAKGDGTLPAHTHPGLAGPPLAESSALLAPSDDASQQDWWFLLRGCPHAPEHSQGPKETCRAGVLGQGFSAWSSDVFLNGGGVT